MAFWNDPNAMVLNFSAMDVVCGGGSCKARCFRAWRLCFAMFHLWLQSPKPRRVRQNIRITVHSLISPQYCDLVSNPSDLEHRSCSSSGWRVLVPPHPVIM